MRRSGVSGATSLEPLVPSADAMARAMEMLRAAHRITADLMQLRDLDATLHGVVTGVQLLGFGVAVMNVVRDDGTVEVTTVAGPDSVRETLLGVREPLEVWQRILDACQDWGALKFMPHELRLVDELNEWVVTEGETIEGIGPWFPDHGHESTRPWHPEDSLFAPMYDASGGLLAVLCVDVPLDGRRPGPLQREVLELFAAHARVAIESARLHEGAERAQRQLEREKEIFREAFDAAPTGMAMISRRTGEDGRLIRVNAALCRLLGRSAEDLATQRLADHVHTEDRHTRVEADADDGPVSEELRYVDASGSSVWVSQSRITVRDTAGCPQYDLVHVLDITASKSREHVLEHDAVHDTLSGLANRRGLYGRLATIVPRQPMAVLFIDLNEFKAVNDTWGHPRGDAVLVEVAQRIAACVRGGDLVARYGGDEFVVVCRDLSLQQARELAGRIELAVAAPMDETLEGRVSASIGLAHGRPACAEDAEALLVQADQEMLALKTSR
jgi:diguanylate cyclase (GGDEF)-like protein/PAS domain S-box-containing protein